jgi:hypothetical protein
MSQPKIDRRGWLAWFLQKRRRERQATDFPAELVAPTLALVGVNYQGTAPMPASIWQFAQSDGSYDSGSVQSWADGADLENAGYDLLPPNQAESGKMFSYCSCRYQVAGVWSAWCAVI